ncbi:cupin [Nocardia sp. NPDC005978]|uniref:cupin n=1 Tax=unclassified Nocardia TaxID=2637762 RepID=UPI0033B72A65
MTTSTAPIVHDTTSWVPRDGATPNPQRLLHGTGLTLVRISFRAGQLLDEHRAVGPIFITCVSGVIDLDVTTAAGTTSHVLEPGSVIHIEPGDPHKLLARTDAVVQVVLQRDVRTTRREG